mmetsp:Transcript_9726/g.21370  ORF Transcript_9726/g.21370 Transcript_9726/m.21370 type:complete len:85 (-) Transcript_9726:90-344(-)
MSCCERAKPTDSDIGEEEEAEEEEKTEEEEEDAKKEGSTAKNCPMAVVAVSQWLLHKICHSCQVVADVKTHPALPCNVDYDPPT